MTVLYITETKALPDVWTAEDEAGEEEEVGCRLEIH